MAVSPYEKKVISIDFPTTGKVNGVAIPERGIVNRGDESGPAFTSISLPPEVLMNEPDLESKVEFMIYLLNETNSPQGHVYDGNFDDGVLKFQNNTRTNDVELKNEQIYQVVNPKDAIEAGPYDISPSAIMTQSKEMADRLSREMGPAFSVLTVEKNIRDFDTGEMERVSNSQDYLSLVGHMTKSLSAYGIDINANSRDVSELIMQGVGQMLTSDKSAILNQALENNKTVYGAILDLSQDKMINPIERNKCEIDTQNPEHPQVLLSNKSDISVLDDDYYMVKVEGEEPYLVSSTPGEVSYIENAQDYLQDMKNEPEIDSPNRLKI